MKTVFTVATLFFLIVSLNVYHYFSLQSDYRAVKEFDRIVCRMHSFLMGALLCYTFHLQRVYKRRKNTFAASLQLKKITNNSDGAYNNITLALQSHYESVYGKETHHPEQSAWHTPKILKWMGSSCSICLFVIVGLLMLYNAAVPLFVAPIMSVYQQNTWCKHTCCVKKNPDNSQATFYVGYQDSGKITEVDKNAVASWSLHRPKYKNFSNKPYLVTGYVNPRNAKEVYIPALMYPYSAFTLISSGIQFFIIFFAICALVFRNRKPSKQNFETL